MTRTLKTLPLLCTILFWHVAHAQRESVPAVFDSVIVPDPKLQGYLQRVADTKPHTIERAQALIDIWRLVRDRHVNRHDIIRQAAYFDSRNPRKHTLIVVAPEVQSDGAIQLILLPYYETPDEELRGVVRRYVGLGSSSVDEIDDPRARQAARFLIGYPNASASELARNLFYSSPSTTLVVLSRTWLSDDLAKLRSIMWTEHLVKDVVWKHQMQFLKPGEVDAAEAELDKLSKFDEWWVRLYVAHMLYRHDDIFDAPETRKRLQKDANPLVVEASHDIFHHGMTETEEKAAWKRLGYPNGRPTTEPLKRIMERQKAGPATKP